MADPLLTDLVDATWAAHQLRVSPRTLHRWINDGRLRAWKVGGRRRVLRQDLDALVRPIVPRAVGSGQPAVGSVQQQTRAQVRAETEAVLQRIWPGREKGA